MTPAPRRSRAPKGEIRTSVLQLISDLGPLRQNGNRAPLPPALADLVGAAFGLFEAGWDDAAVLDLLTQTWTGQNDPAPPGGPAPALRWDPEQRALWVGATRVKTVQRDAHLMAAGLTAFEAAGWPRRLRVFRGPNARERAKTVARRLRADLRPFGFTFATGGAGVLCWRYLGRTTPPERPQAPPLGEK